MYASLIFSRLFVSFDSCENDVRIFNSLLDVHQPRVLETREVITVTTITIETKTVNATDVTTEGIVVIAEIEATGATEEIGVTGEIAVIAKVVIAMVADHAEGDMVATERQRVRLNKYVEMYWCHQGVMSEIVRLCREIKIMNLFCYEKGR